MDVLIFIGMLAIPIGAIWGGIHYKIQSDLKRLDRLLVSLKMGLDYVRNLNYQNRDNQYPELYRKITQDRKELETLVHRHSNRLDTQRYQEAVTMIHIASALKPKGNFLTEVADGMIDLVTDIFPDTKKVASRFRPKGNLNRPDILYQTDQQITDTDTFKKIQLIQHVAPEILERYTTIEKSNQQIVDKLKASQLSNKAELLAIHQGNMRNFRDVLDGYLKIKQAPSQFYKAQERLEQGRTTFTRVETILTDTLRQINENDMMNFEISLRLLEKEG